MRSARLTSPPPPAVVLVAHGSRDPRAGRATYALARAVGPAWDVRAAFLDHAGPRPLDVLASLRPGRQAVLVPLLLTSAYHGRVDIPAVLTAARELPVSVVLAEVLGAGAPEALLDALIGRLAGALSPATANSSAASWPPAVLPAAPGPAPVDAAVPGRAAVGAAVPSSATVGAARVVAGRLDAVVLAAAGTRSAAAREGIAAVADALGARLGLPSAVAYASAAPPAAGEAVERLRAAGARRAGVASYFLAPGLLHDAAIGSALAAGASVAAAPLNDHADLVRLIRARIRSALAVRLPLAA